MWWLRWTRNNFFPFLSFQKRIQNENEISEPEIPWAVIHTDIDGIACKPIRFVLFEVRGWLLIAEIKINPAKSSVRSSTPQMKFKESTNIIAFYRMAHISKFIQRLTSWKASKTTFSLISIFLRLHKCLLMTRPLHVRSSSSSNW